MVPCSFLVTISMIKMDIIFLLVLLVMISFLQVFKHYFEELEEESLRDNFVVVVRRIYHFTSVFSFFLFVKLLFM
jgi:1,4-dihydroxy-2-naphthoate octaprenyltransferase